MYLAHKHNKMSFIFPLNEQQRTALKLAAVCEAVSCLVTPDLKRA
jgi:hypothetical protein